MPSSPQRAKTHPATEKTCNCSQQQLDFFEGYVSAPVVLAGTIKKIDTIELNIESPSGKLSFERIRAKVSVEHCYKGNLKEKSIVLLNKVEGSGMQLREGKKYILFAATSSLAALDSAYTKQWETSKEMGSCQSSPLKLEALNKIQYGFEIYDDVKCCFPNTQGRLEYRYRINTDSVHQCKVWPLDTLVEETAAFGSNDYSSHWFLQQDSALLQYGMFSHTHETQDTLSEFSVVKTGIWYYYDSKNVFWVTQNHGNEHKKVKVNARSKEKPRPSRLRKLLNR